MVAVRTPSDTYRPLAVPIDGFGDAIVTSVAVDEVTNSVIHVGLPTIRRGTNTTWTVDLYPDEALDLAMALIRHARELLT